MRTIELFGARGLLVMIFTGGVATALATEPATEAIEFFEKRVRPVLVERCLECHGQKGFKGGLSLHSRTTLLKGGDTGPAVVPGMPEDSVLIDAIRYEPDGYQMPPGGKLPEEEIAVLTEWVRQGAVWPGSDQPGQVVHEGVDLQERSRHWSFQPVKKVNPPEVKEAAWPRNEIDRFILGRLEQANLPHASEASPATLLRRVTFDLTGLPPTPAEIAAFEADHSEAAWKGVIDRLLASPHYGERWGRHWLDLVRYAETGGHEFDYEIPFTWPYRDYVVRAFNSDVPYDQFVREHLAGDLLESPRLDPATGQNESVVGTAFYWLGQGKHSPVDIRAEECDNVDNQLDVIGKTFQGLTIACARCHDHKFDPILQRDYYALAGFLQSSRQAIVDISPPEPTMAVAGELVAASLRAQPVLLAAAQESWQRLIAELPQRLLSETPEAQEWRKKAIEPARQNRAHPFHLWTEWASRDDLAAQVQSWKERYPVEVAKQAETAKAPFLFPPQQRQGSDGQLLPQWFPQGSAFTTLPQTPWLMGTSPEKPLRGLRSPLQWVSSGAISPRLQGTLRSPTFTIEQPYIDYWMHRRGGDRTPPRQNKVGQVHLIVDGFQIIRYPLHGDLTINVEQRPDSRWYRQDVSRFHGQRAYIEIEDIDAGEIIVDRIEFTATEPAQPELNAWVCQTLLSANVQSTADLAGAYQQVLTRLLEKLREPSSSETILPHTAEGAAVADLVNWLCEEAPPAASTPAVVQALAERQALENRLPAPRWAITMTDGTAEDEHLLVRGNHKKPGDVVSREYLQVLQPVTRAGALGPAVGAVGSGRKEWAECVVDPRNPLTARVLVNRLWQHHFGRGLVPTPDDFGRMGQPPSHPELLDWLAARFMQSGWSIKEMHRLMLQSSTYRQQSQLAAVAVEEQDPQNILLHRMSVLRLEAEPIRDALLALSGRLNPQLYGPSVMPYLTPFMEGRGRPGQSGPLDGDGRRSLYISVRRNFLPPFFLAFDFPTPLSTIGRRSSSNVPAQALTLMNNPFVVQQVGLWADKVTAQPGSVDDHLQQLYRDAFGRAPNADERAMAREFLGESPSAENWRDLAHVLVNVKEFIYIE